MHQKFVRALARYKPKQIPHDMVVILAYFFRLAGRGYGFRARTSSVRQSILLIMKMILHTLVAIVALKAAEINRSEVTKKVDTFAPPHFPNSRQITHHEGFPYRES